MRLRRRIWRAIRVSGARTRPVRVDSGRCPFLSAVLAVLSAVALAEEEASAEEDAWAKEDAWAEADASAKAEAKSKLSIHLQIGIVRADMKVKNQMTMLR